ncbi:MAG: hypothetical protein M3Z96_00025 [Pseudomonadota bacterium]|nr:hypothetical protein [Pseudomonadota bacterium]
MARRRSGRRPGGTWTVLTFVVEHKGASGNKGGTNIIVGQGIVSGGNPPIGGNVTIGLDEKAVVALIARLRAERQTPAAPGEEKRTGAAVQSIGKGAAEGDTRLQQALDLLRANKIADATRLLNAVAGDKTALAKQETARADKDRKEAAIAYRNLDASAGLSDPKRALEAYEKAVASIRTIWIACIGPARYRSITAISIKRKPGSSAC